MPTYLTFVFRDYGEDAWHTDSALLFDEDHVTQEMGTLGISTTPGRKERRLHFKLSHPLTPIQWRELTRLQVAGMFSAFFVSDEAPEETQPIPEHDHVPTDEGSSLHGGNHFRTFTWKMIEGVWGTLCECLTPKGMERCMNRNNLEQYLDIENVDSDLDLFAAALAVKHITTVITCGGNHYSRLDPDSALHPHALEAFLDRAVAAAQRTQRFEQEWRQVQHIFPRMQVAWEKGHTLFQEDLARATANQEEMEYFSMIDFAEDCYAYVNARKTYPEDAACQAWVANGYPEARDAH